MGTAMTNAVNTSAPVTRISERTLDRPSRSVSVTRVSLAEGSSRGLTMPVRDSISHTANIATAIATRAAFIPSVPIMSASEPVLKCSEHFSLFRHGRA
jgi:hypothetical protein